MYLIPSVIIVHQYFHHKKSLAMAMSNLGISVALAVSPFLSSFLLDTYGLQGTLMILGALSLHGCVSATLFIPIKKITAIMEMEKAMETLTSKEHAGEGTIINDALPTSYDATLATPEHPSLNYQRLHDNSQLESTGNSSKALSHELEEDEYVSCSQIIKAYCGGICNARFILHCHVCAGIAYVCETYIAFLPGLVQELGINHAPLLMTVFGILDVFGAVCWGYLFDIPRIEPWRSYLFATVGIAWASAAAIGPIMPNLTGMCAVAVYGGATSGAAFGQSIALVSDYVLPKDIPFAVGVATMFLGLGALVAYPIGGFLAEHYGTYTAGFYVGAGLMGSIAIVTLIYHICRGKHA